MPSLNRSFDSRQWYYFVRFSEFRRNTVRAGKLTRTWKNARSAPAAATRAGSPTQRGSHAARAFYSRRVSRPLTLAGTDPVPPATPRI